MQYSADLPKQAGTQTFQRREVTWSLPPVINEYTLGHISHEWPELTLRYSMARRCRFPDDLRDVNKWPKLPPGVRREMAGQPFIDAKLQMHYIKNAVNVWLTNKMVDDVADATTEALGRSTANTVAIVYPYPLNGVTRNITTKTLAKALAMKLTSKGVIRPKTRLLVETNEIKPSLEHSIYMVARGKRGRTNENEFTHAGTQYQAYRELIAKRLALQPSFAGRVDAETAYILCDDGITAQSTMMNLFNYIASRARVICAITLRATAPECRTLAVPLPTQELLSTLLSNLSTVERSQLQELITSVGCRLDYPDLGNSMLTNVEALLLSAYLLEGGQSQQPQAISLPAFHRASKLPKGNSSQLQKLFKDILENRASCAL